MTTQYTPILQLALPVTGELNGTWGDVVNNNITSMVEEAIAGLATISTWTTNAHTLTTADGTTDEARCAMLVLQTGAGGTALTGAGELICQDETKLYVVKNDAAYAVTVKTSAGSGVTISAGNTAFVFCDGTDVNPCVTQIIDGHVTGNLTVDGNATVYGNTTLGNATSDTITANARIASDLNPSADNTYDLGTSGNSWRNLYIDGTATIATLNVTTIDTTNLEVTNIKAKDGTASATIADATGVMTIGSSVLTTTDINGGTIDATTIGGATPAEGTFTTVAATTGNITTVNATTVDTTNIEVTNLKAKDGTAAGSIADSTGVVTLASSVLTTTDINGGTIDNTTIGGTTPAVGTFTTANATTVDTTNIEVTNVKAKDGTAGMVIADSTGDVSFSSTGALTVSKGTTGQQPGSPTTGMMRYNSTTNQFEGYSGASPAWKSIGGSALSNDTSTASNLYPVFAAATSGTAENLYTSNAKYLYKPSTGELQSAEVVATNGIFVNSQTVSANYTITVGSSAMSAGPVAVAGGVTVTVSSGSRWVVQ